jgi:hypothetical protein
MTQKDMKILVKKFREVIRENTNLTIFYRKYILPENKKLKYAYFIKQINFGERRMSGEFVISEAILSAIKKYLSEK